MDKTGNAIRGHGGTEMESLSLNGIVWLHGVQGESYSRAADEPHRQWAPQSPKPLHLFWSYWSRTW